MNINYVRLCQCTTKLPLLIYRISADNEWVMFYLCSVQSRFYFDDLIQPKQIILVS